MEKPCKRCKKIKDFSEFRLGKSNENGEKLPEATCRQCIKDRAEEKHASITNKTCKKCLETKDKNLFSSKSNTCRKCRQLHRKNDPKEKEYCSKYYQNNQEKILKAAKNYRDNNKEVIAKRKSVFYQENKDKINMTRKKYVTKRMKEDVGYKISHRLRSRFSAAIKNGKKKDSCIKLLGVSIEEFRKYLESKFEDGMTWENWGNGEGCWNLEHIKPIAGFNLENYHEQLECFNWSNMIPLWWSDNKDKSDWIEIDGKKIRARHLKQQGGSLCGLLGSRT